MELFFPKFQRALIDPSDVIAWDPALTRKVEIQVELEIVVRLSIALDGGSG